MTVSTLVNTLLAGEAHKSRVGIVRNSAVAGLRELRWRELKGLAAVFLRGVRESA